MNPPCVLNCGHHFCEPCTTKLYKVKKECALCRTPIKKHKIETDHRFHSMIKHDFRDELNISLVQFEFQGGVFKMKEIQYNRMSCKLIYQIQAQYINNLSFINQKDKWCGNPD